MHNLLKVIHIYDTPKIIYNTSNEEIYEKHISMLNELLINHTK